MAETGAGRRGGGLGSLPAAFGAILLVEILLDIFLLPADEVLIPAELVGDAIYLVAYFLVSWTGRSSPSGRSLSKGRRGTLNGNRRGVTGTGVAEIAAYWLFFVAILAFQWWFAIHHPILEILTLPFEVLFDVILVVGGVLVTIWALVSHRSQQSSRQLGS